jgi:hypothetical protein
MRSQSDREAWIRIRHEDEIPPDAPNNYHSLLLDSGVLCSHVV